jgi:hypothetical protein
MESDKVSVTTEEYEGRSILHVASDGVSFSFDAAHTSIKAWVPMLLTVMGIHEDVGPIELLKAGSLKYALLNLRKGLLLLEFDQDEAKSRWWLSAVVVLPSSTTPDSLVQVIRELHKTQINPTPK